MAELPPNQRDKGFFSEGVDATLGTKRPHTIVDTEGTEPDTRKAARLASFQHTPFGRILTGQRRVSPAAKLERAAHDLPGAIAPAAEIIDQWYGSQGTMVPIDDPRPPPLEIVSNDYSSTSRGRYDSSFGSTTIVHYEWDGNFDPYRYRADRRNQTHRHWWYGPESELDESDGFRRLQQHYAVMRGPNPDYMADRFYTHGGSLELQHSIATGGQALNDDVVFEGGQPVRNTSDAFCSVQ